MGGGDEMVYRVPCRDSAGRAREVVVGLADEPAVTITTPPPGTAVVALDDVQRLIDAVVSMHVLGTAVRGRES